MASEQADEREFGYLEGKRAAGLQVLRLALDMLGLEATEHSRAAWITERVEVVAFLRELCAEFGDNDWPDNLHLRDVLEKHLRPNLLFVRQPDGE